MLTFVLPPAGEVVSGGHLYNEKVIAALRALGHPVQVCDLVGWERHLQAGHRGPFLVDTIYLDQTMGIDLADVDAHLLVHHLSSLAPTDGRSGDQVFAEERGALARFRGFVATSTFTAEYLERRGFPRGAILVAPPAPLVQIGPEHAWPEFAAAEPLRALVVANLVPRKGCLELLEELRRADPDPDHLRLRWVGGTSLDPDYAARCRRIASGPGLRQVVELHGQVEAASMGEQYRWASVLVSAAEMETFGMALQEAAAMGVPILARDAGNVGAHVEHGVTGRLFADVKSLVAGLLAHAADPGDQERLTRGARSLSVQGAKTWAETAQQLAALDPTGGEAGSSGGP